MRHCTRRGFTLIEIMIVILIIGILLAILLPSMVHSKYQAQWTTCGQYEHNLATALESYNAQNGSYPPTLNELTTSSPAYIEILPSCPSNGVSYGIAYTPLHTASTTALYDSFSIYCPGTHYLVLGNVSQGYPQYSPQSGLFYDASH